jgi:hypothetical protein
MMAYEKNKRTKGMGRFRINRNHIIVVVIIRSVQIAREKIDRISL